jgi:Rod binding domain-containing protein
LGKVDNAAQVAKTAQDFEAFFLGQMLQPMFEGLQAEAPFGGGHAEKLWRTMMVDEMGKAMAEAGGIGIADSVQREILRLQEAEQ